jgi:hypothetical protein
MEDLLKRFWTDIIGRAHGPFAFRFVLQPLSAALIACRAGRRDARIARPAYGWAILTNRVERMELLKEGWRELATVFLFAVIIDLIYEILVFHQLHPAQSLMVAALLALLPYPIFRGLANRIFRRWRQSYAGRRQDIPEGHPPRPTL